MDDDDERWVNSQRQRYQPAVTAAGDAAGSRRLPNSDAVLNCPACMSLLCLDCQRSDRQNTQDTHTVTYYDMIRERWLSAAQHLLSLSLLEHCC